MIDFGATEIGLNEEERSRLATLLEVGLLGLDHPSRAEAIALRDRWVKAIKEAIAEEAMFIWPVKVKLADRIGMNRSNVNTALIHPDKMSDQMIALISQADERMALAFPAYRNATDCLYVDPRPVDEIMETAVQRALRALQGGRFNVIGKMRRIIQEQGEGVRK